MNLTDLTEVLRHHAELPPDGAHGPRMSGIQARVKASRRRRAAAVAASLVAVLGVTFALTTPVRRESQPAEPEPTVFSAYHEGTRIVAQVSGRAPASTTVLRFVPTTLDLRVFTRCEAGDEQLLARLTINGHPHGPTTCGFSLDSRYVDLTEYDFQVGSPATLVMSVGEQNGTPEPGPVPADATFALGVGEAVPVEDYPFPPRPESLPSVDSMLGSINPDTRIDVRRADPNQPNGTWRSTVTLPSLPVYVQAASNTPGRITVLVDDVEVYEYEKWTYDDRSGLSLRQDSWETRAGSKVEPGATVDITVIAEGTSGDWAVVLREY
jgi:hypothetical protein